MDEEIVYFIVRDELDDNSEKITLPLNIPYEKEAVLETYDRLAHSPEMSEIEEMYGIHDMNSEHEYEVAYSSYEITEWDDLKLEWERILATMGLLRT